jgi:hypothetical protein
MKEGYQRASFKKIGGSNTELIDLSHEEETEDLEEYERIRSSFPQSIF